MTSSLDITPPADPATDTDARAGTLATIVNQEFVRQHLAARPVIGMMIPNLVGQEPGVTAEIVGVVGNVLKDGNDRQPRPNCISSTDHIASASVSW